VLTLFRKGRISETDLNRQLDQVDREESAIRRNIDEIDSQLRSAECFHAQIASVVPLLDKLRELLDHGIRFDTKRQIVETLVGGIRIDTSERHGVKDSDVHVSFKFARALSNGITVSRSYAPSRPVRIPQTPETIGDHIRLRRISEKLTQKDTAARLQVTASCLFNWEAGTAASGDTSKPANEGYLKTGQWSRRDEFSYNSFW
jgi:DNA-binding transcriptional regulator YiaG